MTKASKRYPDAHRLVIAIDINFDDCKTKKQAKKKARKAWKDACKTFGPLGVTLKGNTVLIVAGLAWCLDQATEYGAMVFVDLKLFDIENTITNTASFMQFYKDVIAIATIAERVKPTTFAAVERYLPNTVICPVNPLTDLDDADFAFWGEKTRALAMGKFYARIAAPKMDSCRGFVCGAGDLRGCTPELIEAKSPVCPGVRPTGLSAKPNGPTDVTLEQAMASGAAYVVIGRPILDHQDPVWATIHCLEIIEAHYTA